MTSILQDRIVLCVRASLLSCIVLCQCLFLLEAVVDTASFQLHKEEEEDVTQFWLFTCTCN